MGIYICKRFVLLHYISMPVYSHVLNKLVYYVEGLHAVIELYAVHSM
jgi:hypothetical protein